MKDTIRIALFWVITQWALNYSKTSITVL